MRSTYSFKLISSTPDFEVLNRADSAILVRLVESSWVRSFRHLRNCSQNFLSTVLNISPNYSHLLTSKENKPTRVEALPGLRAWSPWTSQDPRNLSNDGSRREAPMRGRGPVLESWRSTARRTSRSSRPQASAGTKQRRSHNCLKCQLMTGFGQSRRRDGKTAPRATDNSTRDSFKGGNAGNHECTDSSHTSRVCGSQEKARTAKLSRERRVTGIPSNMQCSPRN